MTKIKNNLTTIRLNFASVIILRNDKLCPAQCCKVIPNNYLAPQKSFNLFSYLLLFPLKNINLAKNKKMIK
jgi:hypothetical protein